MSRLLPRYTSVSSSDALKIDKIVGTKSTEPIVGWEKPATYRSSRRHERQKISKELRGEIIERDGAECYLCGKECDETEIHIDHVHPVSKGGDNHPLNLRVTCAPCNLKKSNRELDTIPAVPIRGVTRQHGNTNALMSDSMQYTDPVGALLHKENTSRKRRIR